MQHTISNDLLIGLLGTLDPVMGNGIPCGIVLGKKEANELASLLRSIECAHKEDYVGVARAIERAPIDCSTICLTDLKSEGEEGVFEITPEDL